MTPTITNEIELVFDKYLEECKYVKALRPETLRTYKEVFKTFLQIMPEVETLSTLSQDILIAFFKRLETRERKFGNNLKVGIKKSTIRTYGSKLNCFFTWLTSVGKLSNNPLQKFKLPNPSYDDHRALKKEEIQRIITAVAIHSANTFLLKRDLLILHLLIFCGLRKNELLSLFIKDIDIENRIITVNADTSKSKFTRKIPIHPTLSLHLRQYLKERKENKYCSPYLLVGNNSDSGFTAHGLKHWVAKIIRLTGIKFHVHRFRHTFATNLAYQNIGAVKIQKLMGHSSLNMTSKYLRSMNAEGLGDDIAKLSIDTLV